MPPSSRARCRCRRHSRRCCCLQGVQHRRLQLHTPASSPPARPAPGRRLVRAEHPAPGQGLMPTPAPACLPSPARFSLSAPSPTPPRPGLRRFFKNQVEVVRLSTLPATPESSQRPHFSLLQCPRRRHVGADEPSTPWSPSAAPAATSDLSAAAKQQQTEPRHPETPGPRQVECPKGHAN